VHLPTEDEFKPPEKFEMKDCARHWDIVQCHLEILADLLMGAYQVVSENNRNGRVKAEGILQPRDKAGYFSVKRCGISEREGEWPT
jgi:hypothetical protein